MGIGGKGESGAAVPQHAGYGLDIDTVLQGEGREGVPQIVEADVLQPGMLISIPLSRSLETLKPKQ